MQKVAATESAFAAQMFLVQVVELPSSFHSMGNKAQRTLGMAGCPCAKCTLEQLIEVHPPSRTGGEPVAVFDSPLTKEKSSLRKMAEQEGCLMTMTVHRTRAILADVNVASVEKGSVVGGDFPVLHW